MIRFTTFGPIMPSGRPRHFDLGLADGKIEVIEDDYYIFFYEFLVVFPEVLNYLFYCAAAQIHVTFLLVIGLLLFRYLC